MKYPGHIIKKGEKDGNIVKAIKKQLNIKLNAGLDETNTNFGNATVAAVKLFQTRNIDSEGNPLKIDGTIGSLTWEALFGKPAANNNTATSFLQKVIDKAKTQLDVKEVPDGSNKGPEVNQYLASVGLGGGYSWCAAFVYWCFNEVCKQTNKTNPLHKTGGVLNHWNNTKGTKIKAQAAKDNPAIIKPGHIFIMDYGGGLGHTGIVTKVANGYIYTIEGNTNSQSSREGNGVYERKRKIADINKGFIVY